MHSQYSRVLAVSTVMCFPCGHSDPACRSFARSLRLAFPRAMVPLIAVMGFANGSISGARDGQQLYLCLHLIGSVPSLRIWKQALTNVSRWVLQTIEKGYQIQFGSRPPTFMGVLSTVVGPEQVLVMEQEVKTLLEKGAIEYVPPSNRETEFYSW